MNTCGKTAWLIGPLENLSVEQDLAEKGYTLKKFSSEKASVFSLSDDHPDMVIFAEDILHKDSLFFKLSDFFPGTLVVSIGSTEPRETNDATLEASMERLIESLKGITQG